MIILTVGTQLPFDRLVKAVDEIAPQFAVPVLAQIGGGKYVPGNMEWRRTIAPVDFEKLVSECSLIVAHAGVGTIVTAQRHLKPLIIFPRLASLQEHRNEHQMATSNAMSGRAGIALATTRDELRAAMLNPPPPPCSVAPPARRLQITQTVASFVLDALKPNGGQAS